MSTAAATRWQFGISVYTHEISFNKFPDLEFDMYRIASALVINAFFMPFIKEGIEMLRVYKLN
jgi:hypothetical protein